MRVDPIVDQTSVLDRLLRVLALALVVTTVGFAIYYYADRRASPQPGLVERSVAQAEDAVRADPGDPGRRLALADLYLAAARYDEAITQYSTALLLDDQALPAHRGLGLAYVAQGQYAAAERELQPVIDARKDSEFAGVDRDLEEAYYFVARAQLGAGWPAAARESLQQALQIDRADADAWELLATVYVATEDFAAARDAATTAARFTPTVREPYALLVQIYRALGDEEGARYARGMLAYADGKYDEAIGELRAVTQAQPDRWEAWTGLGLAHEAKLQKQEAADAYVQALTGNHDDYSARAGLIRLGVAQTHP
jgi:tetratricopeptide (TPR) repeat protein